MTAPDRAAAPAPLAGGTLAALAVREKLTYPMRRALEKAPTDWTKKGYDVQWPTLDALKKRGLIEVRLDPTQRHRMFADWQWRLAAALRARDAGGA